MQRTTLLLLLILLLPNTASADVDAKEKLLLEMADISGEIMEISKELIVLSSQRFPCKEAPAGANVEKEGGITATLQVVETNLVHAQVSMNQLLLMFMGYSEFYDGSQLPILGQLTTNELKRLNYIKSHFRTNSFVIDVMEGREKELCLKGISLLDAWLDKYEELAAVSSSNQ